MEALRKCFNPKVIIGLALVAIGIAVFAPNQLAAALPLLLLAACPLSMVIMMLMMHKTSQPAQSSDTLQKEKEPV